MEPCGTTECTLDLERIENFYQKILQVIVSFSPARDSNRHKPATKALSERTPALTTRLSESWHF